MNTRLELDRADRLIISTLSNNARLPIAQLAKNTRLGSDLVRYRIDRMTEFRVVQRYSAVIDWNRLGVYLFKVYLRLQRSSVAEGPLQKRIGKALALHWFARLYGRWDCLFTFRAKNTSHAFELLTQGLRGSESSILDQEILALVSHTRFPTTLVEGIARPALQLGDNSEILKIDERETRLLSIMQADARISTLSLAERLDVTPAIADYQLKKLEQQKIIVGYRLHLDYEVLGLMLFKVCLVLKNNGSISFKRLYAFCLGHRHAVCLIRQLGSWFAEIEVEVEHQDELHRVIEELERVLKEDLLSVNYLLVKDAYFLSRPEVA